MNFSRPPIALTLGEAAGIGPDLILKLADQASLADAVLITYPIMLQLRAQVLALPINLIPYSPEATAETPIGSLRVLAHSCPHPEVCGTPLEVNANYVLETIRTAARGCLA